MNGVIVTCEQCKWWDKDPYLVAHHSWSENYDSVVHMCHCPKVTESSDYLAEDVLTQCGMDAGYPSTCTGPNFGCVHGEAN